MTDYNHITIGLAFLRDAYLSSKGTGYLVTCFQVNVDAIMIAPLPHSEIGTHIAAERMVIATVRRIVHVDLNGVLPMHKIQLLTMDDRSIPFTVQVVGRKKQEGIGEGEHTSNIQGVLVGFSPWRVSRPEREGCRSV